MAHYIVYGELKPMPALPEQLNGRKNMNDRDFCLGIRINTKSFR